MTRTDPLPCRPLTVHTLGDTPPLWRDQSAIFISNLLAFFFGNEEQAQMLENEIPGSDSYGARLLPIMGLLFDGGQNLLVLEREPDADLTAYFRDDLGLRLPEVAVLSHPDYLALSKALRTGGPLPHEAMLRTWREHPASAMDGFVTDDTIALLAKRLGKRTLCTPEGSRAGNNKLLLHQHLERKGLPVFETQLAAASGRRAALPARTRAAGLRRGRGEGADRRLGYRIDQDVHARPGRAGSGSAVFRGSVHGAGLDEPGAPRRHRHP